MKERPNVQALNAAQQQPPEIRPEHTAALQTEAISINAVVTQMQLKGRHIWGPTDVQVKHGIQYYLGFITDGVEQKTEAGMHDPTPAPQKASPVLDMAQEILAAGKAREPAPQKPAEQEMPRQAAE